MNKIREVFQSKNRLINIYITAGYPKLESTITLIKNLNKAGVDIIEVGIPYSDPLADGTTIQKSSEVALRNGMKLHILFEQLKSISNQITCPLILMGYFNQMLQYGPEKFLMDAKEAGVSGLIIPDLPMYIYKKEYEEMFVKNEIGISFLISPQTSEERIFEADSLSTSFIYMVSSSAITGNANSISNSQIDYFKRINDMKLKSPRMIGFGIHDKNTFDTACKYSNGAIIGSAFIRALAQNESNEETFVKEFINHIRD